MAVRTVKFELEAKLKPVSGGFFSNPGGKLERKTYGDMTERLKVSVRHLKIPDGSRAIVTADGNKIAMLEIEKGTGEFDEETSDPSKLPGLKPGQLIEVTVNGNTVLKGILYQD